MRKTLIATFLCACLSISAQNHSSVEEAISNYDYSKALQLIDSEKNATTKLTSQKALVLKGLNRYTEAIPLYTQLLQKDSKNVRLLTELAECYRLSGKYNEASNLYKQILEDNPENRYASLQYISLLCGMEQFKRAKEACQTYLRNDSSNTSLKQLAQCHEALNENNSAMNCYNHILKNDSTDYIATARLASLYIKCEDYVNAIICTEKYKEIDSSQIVINRLNAQAYCLNKQYKEAINQYEKLVAQGDSSTLTCHYLGICYYADEKFYEAHDYLEAAIKNDPNNINLLYYLARACSKTSWKKEGIDYMNKAIRLTTPSDETYTNLYQGLADCYNLAQKPKEQIQALLEQYKYDKNNHQLLFTIGRIYQDALEDMSRAKKYLEMFMATRPEKQTKEEDPEGTVSASLYNVAERRLDAIRKEQFFREGVPSKMIINNKEYKAVN